MEVDDRMEVLATDYKKF